MRLVIGLRRPENFPGYGIYVEHSKVILLSGTSDYVRAVLIPAIIIIVCLTAALLSLEKRDIHI